MQGSFRGSRDRDLGYHQGADSLSEGEPMVLGMSDDGFSNGHHQDGEMRSGYGGHSARESSSGGSKKTPPANGKKTKGRVKIKMEFIDNKLRRYTTFSKRKTGIMKKAYELSTLTGTQVMLLVASETGHVYTFATRKLQPMITSEAGKALIQTCLNSPDPPPGPGASGLDQRMSATGFEETDLTYSVADDCDKMSEDKPVYATELSSALLAPSLVSFANSLPTTTTASQRQVSNKSTGNSFATILTAATSTDNAVSPTLRMAAFQSPDSPDSASSQRESPLQTVYGIPASQQFSLAISGGTKNQGIPVSSSESGASSHNSISVVQGSTQNLSVVSGNVMIPAGQTILQGSGGQAVVYQTAQGLVYATPTNLPEGVMLNLGQEQGAQQQFITIPVSLALTAQQQQLIQRSQGQSQNSSFNLTSNTRREKSRK